MDMISRGGPSVERVAASWIVAGLLLLMLVGLSFSTEAPVEAVAVPQDGPVYAIDEDLIPLESGALDQQGQYADLIVPASYEPAAAYEPDEFRTGVAP